MRREPDGQAAAGWSCRWVPGTLDRVRVRSCSGGERHLSLRELTRLAGRAVLHDLYLRGRSGGECPDSACLALGCRPPGLARVGEQVAVLK